MDTNLSISLDKNIMSVLTVNIVPFKIQNEIPHSHNSLNDKKMELIRKGYKQ